MYTDETIMTNGIHKGKKLANVPAYYLLELLEKNKCTKKLKAYILDNIDILKKEADL